MTFLSLALSASIQFGMLSGFSYLPVEDALYTRDQVNLPPQYVNIYIDGTKTIYLDSPLEIIPFGGIDNSFTFKNLDSCSPFDITWSVGIKAKYKNVEFSYTRECHHPTTTYVLEAPHTAQRLARASGEGISHDVYVKFTIGDKK